MPAAPGSWERPAHGFSLPAAEGAHPASTGTLTSASRSWGGPGGFPPGGATPANSTISDFRPPDCEQ